MSQIKTNTTALQDLLDAASNLPKPIDTSDATATSSKILSGYTAYVKDKMIAGNIPNKTVSDVSVNGNTVNIPAGNYENDVLKSVDVVTQATPSINVDSAGKITATSTQTEGYVSAGTKSATKQLATQGAKTVTPTTSAQTAVSSGTYVTGDIKVAAMPTATQATPTVSIDSAGKITATATQTAGYVSAGTKTGTKQLTTQAAKTVTPSTSEQTAVASGVYTTGAVKVAGDANLIAANIKKGVSIFGVSGSVDEEKYNVEINVDSGATVTATNGSETITGTSSNGKFTFSVYETGKWDCSATLDGVEALDSTVNVTNTFSTNLIFFHANIVINTSPNADITYTNGDVTLTDIAGSDGTATIIIRNPGEWIITASKDGKSMSETVTVTSEDTYIIDMFLEILTLNSNTWAKIREISDAGTARNYWSVGDCKAVTLSGTVGTVELNTTLYAYIIGFDHNSEIEGNGIHFGCFKTLPTSNGVSVAIVDSNYATGPNDGRLAFNYNHWGNRGFGGWYSCDMRYDILGSTDIAPDGYGLFPDNTRKGYAPSDTCATNPVPNTLMSCLPSDLRSVMKPIIKYSNSSFVTVGNNWITISEYLPLLSKDEITGESTSHDKQYAYYSAGNSKINYKHNNTSTMAAYQTRSSGTGESNKWYAFASNGTLNKYEVCTSLGISPIFMV